MIIRYIFFFFFQKPGTQNYQFAQQNQFLFKNQNQKRNAQTKNHRVSTSVEFNYLVY